MTMLANAPIEGWIDHLERITRPALDAHAALPIGDLERPFRDAVVEPDRALDPGGDKSPEVTLWRAHRDPHLDVEHIVRPDRDGPLLDADRFRAIEVWTDSELSALHALWWLARTHAPWSARLERARLWHITNTQPDNATNRPWALHVFLLAGDAEGKHYAETLLHNAMVMGGAPEVLSAWILWDCVRALRAR